MKLTSGFRLSQKPDRRRALELLAASRDGCTVEPTVELVRAGLATATGERVVAGRQKMEIARVRITEAGRRAVTPGTGTQ